MRRIGRLPPEELRRARQFYEQAIDDRVEDGQTEAEAVAALGSIDEIVREIMANVPRDALIHVLSEDGTVDFAPPQNGVLTVSQKVPSGGKLFNLDLDLGSSDITALVPRELPVKMRFAVTTVSGDIGFELSRLADAARVEFSTTSGGIDFPSLDCGYLNVSSVSGDISIVFSEK